MSTLAKRATPRQAMVLRMVEGAVMNAAHAHPRYKIDRRFARSVAKRAAGTLTSQWRDVLAVPQGQSEGEARDRDVPASQGGRGPIGIRIRRRWYLAANGNGTARVIGPARAVLVRLHGEISSMVKPARGSGNEEYAAALIDVLKIIGRELAKDTE